MGPDRAVEITEGETITILRAGTSITQPASGALANLANRGTVRLGGGLVIAPPGFNGPAYASQSATPSGVASGNGLKSSHTRPLMEGGSDKNGSKAGNNSKNGNNQDDGKQDGNEGNDDNDGKPSRNCKPKVSPSGPKDDCSKHDD